MGVRGQHQRLGIGDHEVTGRAHHLNQVTQPWSCGIVDPLSVGGVPTPRTRWTVICSRAPVVVLLDPDDRRDESGGDVLDLDTELSHGNTWSVHHGIMRHHHGECTRSVWRRSTRQCRLVITSPPCRRPATLH